MLWGRKIKKLREFKSWFGYDLVYRRLIDSYFCRVTVGVTTCRNPRCLQGIVNELYRCSLTKKRYTALNIILYFVSCVLSLLKLAYPMVECAWSQINTQTSFKEHTLLEADGEF